MTGSSPAVPAAPAGCADAPVEAIDASSRSRVKVAAVARGSSITITNPLTPDRVSSRPGVVGKRTGTTRSADQDHRLNGRSDR